jgi:hypothetical protein
MGSNILGSIYTTTISAEKYIVITSQNIELSGNVIISNGLLNTNSLIPNVPNSASLGSTGNNWSNAYINDVSINNNLQVTGNVYISGNLEASNIYTKSTIDASFANLYTIDHIDNSFQNVYTIEHIDNSFGNVYTRGYFDQSYQNVYTRGYIDQSFQNVYTRGLIDTSFANVYTRGVIDTSFANVYTRGHIDLSFQNVYTRGHIDQSFANVYTRGYIDQSFANVYTRGVIDTSFANVYTRIQLDNSFVTKRVVELSLNALPASGGGGGSSSSIVLTSISNDLVPLTTNTYDLGSTTRYWNNAYINNLRLSNRGYQEISGDITWSAVNGYYGLAKDAYPGLNPSSSGVLAVRTWTGRTAPAADWTAVCWSPQLRLFVAVGRGTKIMTSPNGTTWTLQSPPDSGSLYGVCWSPELTLFVAVSEDGTNRVMTSSNAISWASLAQGSTYNVRWRSVCWSPQLRIFVAVGETGEFMIMTSNNGSNWTFRGQQYTYFGLKSICWSPELCLFVAVGQLQIVTSKNGIDWNLISISNSWSSVCWSPQLGIFVALSGNGSNSRVIYSSNGLNWFQANVRLDYYTFGNVCWSPELRIFIAVAFFSADSTAITSNDGINWTSIPTTLLYAQSICWSPELGIFTIIGSNGTNYIMTSSLKGRPPTSYNVFDSSFNRIDETGKWTFSNIDVTTLNVTGTFTNSSDDRLKHNEVVIANGLDVIDRLTPKFYQKTQVLLDTSYNGDLSSQAWTYEAGLIAQELLQIPDLSFAVSGGDYYQESYNYYDMSANYDISTNYINRANYYDTSANYDISYNLITQPYSLNYTSIYVYVFAAIKELHAKVKAQETAIYNRQAIINNCITRIETLEQRNQV